MINNPVVSFHINGYTIAYSRATVLFNNPFSMIYAYLSVARLVPIVSFEEMTIRIIFFFKTHSNRRIWIIDQPPRLFGKHNFNEVSKSFEPHAPLLLGCT